MLTCCSIKGKVTDNLTTLNDIINKYSQVVVTAIIIIITIIIIAICNFFRKGIVDPLEGETDMDQFIEEEEKEYTRKGNESETTLQGKQDEVAGNVVKSNL